MRRILIADDEKNIRLALSRAFTKENYCIDVACDGLETLEKVKGEKYELILMDIQMPHKSGIDILKELKDCGEMPKIIMMSAYGTVDLAVSVMKLGAIDFINKPFTLKEIKKRVRDVLELD